jgi:hypothetical protein
VDAHTLDAIDLAEEVMLNARDRVMLALKGGPAYPTDIAETCIMPLGTVKNELTRLRKRGLVEYTGEVQGQARQVCLIDDGDSVTGVTAPLRDCGAVTPDKDDPLGSVRVNDRGEAEF